MRLAVGRLVGIVVVLAGLVSAVHALSLLAGSGPAVNLYSASDGLNEFKMKMANTLSSVNDRKDDNLDLNNEQAASGFKANFSSIGSSVINRSSINRSGVNKSSVNQSADNLSAFRPYAFNSYASNVSEPDSSVVNRLPFPLAPNLSSVNQSAENKAKGFQGLKNSTLKADSGSSTFSQSGSVSQSGIHFDNQAAFNGFWSMQANKHGFGSSGINDRMTLSGDFNVQKSVSFKE